MDNNASERAIRGFCIGKKNWEVIDTINGAKTSAVIYSIAETAKANNLKPYEYFEHLLTVIPEHMEDTDRSFWKSCSPGLRRFRKTFENKIYSRPRKWLKIVKVLAMDRLPIAES